MFLLKVALTNQTHLRADAIRKEIRGLKMWKYVNKTQWNLIKGDTLIYFSQYQRPSLTKI